MKNNLIVFLLPVSVMVLLFIFGFYTIGQNQEITNEDLQNHVLLDLEVEDHESGVLVDLNWRWTDVPGESLLGADVMEVVVFSETMEPLPVTWGSGSLHLTQSGETLYETSEFIETDNGIAVVFETKLDENLVYGATGFLSIPIKESDQNAAHIGVRYYHSWSDTSDVIVVGGNVETTFDDRSVDYWMLQRTLPLP